MMSDTIEVEEGTTSSAIFDQVVEASECKGFVIYYHLSPEVLETDEEEEEYAFVITYISREGATITHDGILKLKVGTTRVEALKQIRSNIGYTRPILFWSLEKNKL